MTAAAPPTCSTGCKPGKSCSPTGPMTAMRCATPWKAQGAWANIKPMPNRRNPPAFSPFLYRYRNLVERFFNKIKHFRAIATRYEKRAANYLALVKLASIRIWLRHNESVT